jgi:hypothetical protein
MERYLLVMSEHIQTEVADVPKPTLVIRAIKTAGTAAMFLTMMTSANAGVIAVNYVGVVDYVGSLGTGAVPAGINIGATVQGQFIFNTAQAGAPAYTFSSCSPGCGSTASASFAFTSGLTQSVSIAGHTWSNSGGEAFLTDGSLFDAPYQAFGVSSTHYANDTSNGGVYLSLSYTDSTDPAELLADINSLDDSQLNLAAANATSGTIFTGVQDGYVIYYHLVPQTDPDPVAVPEPSTLALLLGGLIATTSRRRSQAR